MNNNQLTKERLQEIAEDGFLKHGESKELARTVLAAMDSEPVVWNNGCNKSVPAALRYLAENPRPIGGESSFNTAHLYQLAREIELMAEAPLYRHAPPAPVVSEDIRQIENVAAALEHIGNFSDAATILQLVSGEAAPVCTCPSGDGSLRWPCPVHPGNSPVIPDGMLKIGYMFITAEGGTAFSISDVPVPGMTLAGPVYAPAVKAGGQQNAPQNIPEIIPESCTWTFSNYDDHWSGTCGVEWIFPDGGPEENGVKFCPKCGKSVAISATE